ncbi:polyphosphate--nucleotide phosphotransferase [Aerococcaceae bacterium DSM 111022]|nr:polyphosphate--nucleotide phosphotransferase [Aerococcaceae bacterium DSM 111022]
MDLSKYKVAKDTETTLSDYKVKVINDEEETLIKEELLPPLVEELQQLQTKLTAEAKQGVVVVLQALDAAGKDELIEYVFSNLMPQSLKITSFDKPNEQELKHDYLWRMAEGMPERGQIGILNRSHYEEIIAPLIHDSLENQPLPDRIKDDSEIIQKRFKHINNYEEYLYENGFSVIKFYFNMSPEKQKERLLERLTNPEKQWEFSYSDIEDRRKWDEHQKVFEKMIRKTANTHAPWYILPADNAWFSRYVATAAMVEVLKDLNPQFPEISNEEQKKMDKAIDELKQE